MIISKHLSCFIAVLCVIAFVSICIYSSRHKSQTIDEIAHLHYGRAILNTGVQQAKPLDGSTPLFVVHALIDRFAEKHKTEIRRNFGANKLQVNRLGTLIFAVALIVIVWLWSSYSFGWTVGTATLILVSFSPTIMAHSKWMTTDIVACLGLTLGFFSMISFLARPTLVRLLFFLIAVPIAFVVKSSGVLLFILYLPTAFLSILIRWYKSGRFPNRYFNYIVASIFVLISSSLLIINIAFQSGSIEKPLSKRYIGKEFPKISVFFDRISSGKFPIAEMYLQRLEMSLKHNKKGHNSYLLGKRSQTASPAYFPVTFLLKTPIPLTLLITLSLFTALKTKRPHGWHDFYLLAFPLGYLSYVSLASNIAIGHRFLLPVYPMLFCFAARLLSDLSVESKKISTLGFGLVSLFVVESLNTAPHHLSYFNQLIGNRCNAWKYLSDSNVNWGQDRWYMQQWVNKQKQKVSVNPEMKTQGTIVISEAFLTRRYEKTRHGWLKENYQPLSCITPGWLIFEVDGIESEVGDLIGNTLGQ